MGGLTFLQDFVSHTGKFEKIEGFYVAARGTPLEIRGSKGVKNVGAVMSWNTNVNQALAALEKGKGHAAFHCYANAAAHVKAVTQIKQQREKSQDAPPIPTSLAFLKKYAKYGEGFARSCICPSKKWGLKTPLREVPLLGPLLSLLISTLLYLYVCFQLNAPWGLQLQLISRLFAAEAIALVPGVGPLVSVLLSPDSHASEELQLLQQLRTVSNNGRLEEISPKQMRNLFKEMKREAGAA